MPRASFVFLLTASLLTVLLAACVPALTPVPSPTGRGESALTPTATLTLTPTTTPTVTPTPTPTPLPHPAAFDDAFARGLIRYENGQWLVTAVQPADGEQQTADFLLLPDTFNTHDDLRAKNPLAPLTVRARPLTPTPLPMGDPLTGAGGPGVREYTLLWNPDTAEFRLAYTFPTLFEGIGTDSPRLIEENLDAIPFIPIEDIQSGLAAQSVMLQIQQDDYHPYTDETIYYYKKNGGNSLQFFMTGDGEKMVILKAKTNDRDTTKGDARLSRNNTAIQISPYWIKTKIGEKIYYLNAFTLLDPSNPENPDKDEYKIIFGIPVWVGKGENVISFDDPTYNYADFYRYSETAQFLGPNVIRLYGDEKYQQNHPLLARLLGIEGNDARLADDYMKGLINRGINDLGVLDDLLELPLTGDGYHIRLPANWQTDVVPFEVGVAQ